ncbi:CheY-like protein [Hesseltinella vesiculosa]|uniref:CheY-like protein n=1 Tax=Hesseltinella vesiculosa TaxID=101127 RepID=A0A1X2GFG7_9FUNG|nr:CheY-like protein [Hesseltinella vesiculosa]
MMFDQPNSLSFQMIPPSPPPSSSSTHFPRLKRFLLVDDNPINLELLKRMLGTLTTSYITTMDCASNGCQALEYLEKNAYDVIFMDIDMPILNGVETTIQIRTMSSLILACNQAIPIIAVTTKDSLEARQLYKDVGMDACLAKPVLPHLLKSHLFHILH